MYTTPLSAQKTAGQPHVAGALRQFADSECLNDIAKGCAIKPQMLRNKLILEQPHQLSIHELVRITKTSGNRAIIDGILLELDCIASVSAPQLADAEQVSPTRRILDVMTHSAALGDLAKDIEATRRVTQRQRHAVINRSSRIMAELAIFAHEVEAKFQAVPLLTVASDVMQNLPVPGLM